MKARISLFHPDILAISEVCPKHYYVTIPPESLHLQGYDLFCSDFSSGRGICLYCKSSLKADKYDDLKINDFKESLWCSVPVDRNNFILVGVIYHSPSSSTANDIHLMNLNTEATCNCKPHLLIMGDFNFPDITWEDWSSAGGMCKVTFSYPHFMTTSFSNTQSFQLGIERIRIHLCLTYSLQMKKYDLEHSFYRTFR